MEHIGFLKQLMVAFSKGSETFRGMTFISKIEKHIAVFGSARFQEDSPQYQAGLQMGEMIAGLGYGVITGGGPGIMEAANKGASQHSKPLSYSASIHLPDETCINKYTKNNYHCQYFTIRKMLLTSYCEAIVLMPGGYGTFDELFEVLTLIKTRKMPAKPIILYDTKFWSPLLNFLTESCLTYGTVNQSEIDLLTVVDDIESCQKELVEKLCLPTS